MEEEIYAPFFLEIVLIQGRIQENVKGANIPVRIFKKMKNIYQFLSVHADLRIIRVLSRDHSGHILVVHVTAGLNIWNFLLILNFFLTLRVSVVMLASFSLLVPSPYMLNGDVGHIRWSTW